jgi:hypothetical protein
VLDALFAGIDLITESDAGRTFSALRLLTDPVQSATLDEALDQLMTREFVAGHRTSVYSILMNWTRHFKAPPLIRVPTRCVANWSDPIKLARPNMFSSC